MDEFSGYHGVKAKVQLDRVLLSRNFDQERHSIVDRTSASGLVFRCENQTAWRRRFRSASAHQFCEFLLSSMPSASSAGRFNLCSATSRWLLTLADGYSLFSNPSSP